MIRRAAPCQDELEIPQPRKASLNQSVGRSPISISLVWWEDWTSTSTAPVRIGALLAFCIRETEDAASRVQEILPIPTRRPRMANRLFRECLCRPA